MTMTLEQVLQASAAEIEFLATKDQLNVTDHDRHLRLLASLRNAIAHLTQPAQSCQHDWAEGYGVPAYCNHCGKARDSQPTQSVDVEKVREVIASLYAPGHPTMTAAADKLAAALQESDRG